MHKLIIAVVMAFACAYFVGAIVIPTFARINSAVELALAHSGELANGKLANQQ